MDKEIAAAAIAQAIRQLRRFFILLLFGTSLALVLTPDAAVASPLPPPVSSLQAPGAIPPGYSSDIFDVKFRDGLDVRLRNEQLVGLAPQAAQELSQIRAQYHVTRIQRLLTVAEERIDALRAAAQARTGRALPDMNLWFRFSLKDGAQGENFLGAMQGLEQVESVQPAPLPQPLPEEPSKITPDFTSRQDHLKPAPEGINAPFAWQVPGGNGAGITITDVEYSWSETHEDISKAYGVELLVNPGDWAVDPFDDNNHGTAVLGLLVGDRNGIGILGIAWGAEIQLAPANTALLGYNLANAIMLATNASSAGDVILIEQQMPVCGWGWGGWGPVEWDQPVYDQIQIAVGLGITVVEAAGNGGVNLDQPACADLFNRKVRDSGAIIVGAGRSPASGHDREREVFSDYGDRVDLQGQGDSVGTTGYGGRITGYCNTPGLGYINPDDPENPNYWYTACFNGTSSASPIIAGSAADIQGAVKIRKGAPLSPADLRTTLVSTGSSQSPTVAGHIGPRPDLKEALLSLRNW